MSLIEKYKLASLFRPDADQTFFMIYCLFNNVSNTEQLTADYETTDICLIDPSLIVDERQLQVATETALFHHHSGKAKTRNLNTEILFCLSPNNNISWSLQTFGSKSQDDHLIAIKVVEEERLDRNTNPFGLVNGNPIPFSDLKHITNESKVREIYNIPSFVVSIDHLLESILNNISAKHLL
ncbi:EKC/KEOPS complex subunit TPRKB [Tetranychus urticae]|uniref:EKC/KEOPS complex subunit TPRKB n=1 Tax=Tetranychus urticae TaxID=32264 RepID=UPI00077BAB76|nr:EKC/KEOPS complex subunit TPRKB [Tetranychus urticae]